MPERADNLQKRTSLWTRAVSFWTYHTPIADADDCTPVALDLDSPAVGEDVLLTARYCTLGALSLTLTGQTTDEEATFTLAGEDQFGDSVSEDLALVHGTAVPTTYCYRKLDSLELVSIDAGSELVTGDNIDIGHLPTATTFRIPMYSKGLPAAAIAGMSSSLGAWTDFVVNTDESNITVTTAVEAEKPVFIYLNPDFAHKY